MFKKIFFQIHWFLGITAGLILSIMGVTGAIYSYDQQILKLINHDSYVVEIPENNTAEKLNPEQIYTHFLTYYPDIKINSITIAVDPKLSSTVNIQKEGERRGYNMMINPYNAIILPEIKGRAFFQFIQQLHRNLTVGPVGKQITGACTLMLIFFVLSGLYLRWPKKHSWRQWFAIKPKLKGRNFIWDLHAVVGTWVVIFYLLLAVTGLYWSYDWWRSGLFKVMGVERPVPQMQAGRAPTASGAQAGAGPNRQMQPRTENSRAIEQTNTIGPVQIQTALSATWTGFNQQLNREYSSLTLSLPKSTKPEIELSFIDAIPQHERARNNAVYNYQTQQIEKLELYEDKKLNEKFMSSMLPVHRGSFFGPVVQFIIMLAALTMPLFFVTGWMLYLKRRKQKKLTLAAKQSNNQTYIDPNAKPWLICYASQTGVSEQLAWRTATSLQEANQPVTVKPIQQLSAEELSKTPQILFVVSTYGTGEAPDLASHFEKKVLTTSLNLSHLNYAILALGSKEYHETYCSFGHRLNQWLQQSGAQALFELIEVDNANPAHIANWNQSLNQHTQLDLQSMQIETTFDTWQLEQRTLLNPDSLGAPAYNLDLVSNYDVTWQAGDIAVIQPGNSSERIEQFLSAHHANFKDTNRDELANLYESIWDKDLTQPIGTYQSLAELLAQLPTLAHREYSIASIPEQKLLRLTVRQHRNEQGELGLGSGWLTAHIHPQSSVALRIRTNESFHLIDDNRPIICIGNGTGISGLMSLLHTRALQGYHDNWLIFGERQSAHDYFYQDILFNWQQTGVLKRLDLAFSREPSNSVYLRGYVQDVLRQHADELRLWVERGAILYVCGSVVGMAAGVDEALIAILGETLVDQMRLEGRYRRDVY